MVYKILSALLAILAVAVLLHNPKCPKLNGTYSFAPPGSSSTCTGVIVGTKQGEDGVFLYKVKILSCDGGPQIDGTAYIKLEHIIGLTWCAI